MIRLEHVSKGYQLGKKQIQALTDLNITVEQGEFVAVMGRSGSGKSTFLKIAGTLEQPDEGKVWIGDQELQTLSEQELCKMRQTEIGFVFQKYQLLPEYSVWDNVCMPLYIAHQEPEVSYIQSILQHVGLWERRMDYPEELSGGEQQRVAIARAMSAKPELILADEPTGNLDYRTGQEIMRMLRASRELYLQTIVMVTHDMESANYADRIVILEDGKLR